MRQAVTGKEGAGACHASVSAGGSDAAGLRRLPKPDELSANARQSGKPFVVQLVEKLMDRPLAVSPGVRSGNSIGPAATGVTSSSHPSQPTRGIALAFALGRTIERQKGWRFGVRTFAMPPTPRTDHLSSALRPFLKTAALPARFPSARLSTGFSVRWFLSSVVMLEIQRARGGLLRAEGPARSVCWPVGLPDKGRKGDVQGP